MTAEHSSTPPEMIEAMLALALGTLEDDAAADRLRRQLAQDPWLATEMSRISRLVDALRQGPLASPPAAVAAKARGLLAGSDAASPEGLFQRLATVIATLIFDSRSEQALAGFRSAPALDVASFHLTFESPSGEVDLQIRSGPPGTDVRVLGQVESDQSAHQAILRQRQEAVCATDIDSHGMFSLDAPPGMYDLDIILEQAIIRVPSLDLA